METLKQAHGNWVDGDRFWDREREIEIFIEALDEGAHLHLVAQRRIGKTSLMREVARRIESRYVCLHVDLQKARRAEDMIVELSMATHRHKDIWEKTREVFGNALKAIAQVVESVGIDEVNLKIREGLHPANWQTKGGRLLVALAECDQGVVVFMDEVPILVNRILKGPDYDMTPDRIAAADQVMSWLREASIRHRGKIRFVVTGSIGFEPILRQAGLSATINNFKPFHLEPWDPSTAVGCLRALANGYGVRFDAGAAEKVAEMLGCCIPHHVQMFFAHLYETCKRRGDTLCTEVDVEHVYRTAMLSTRGHAELSTFEERLKTMVGNEGVPFVLDLLTEAAVVGVLEIDALSILRADYKLGDRSGMERTREVLDILRHDGYLIKTPAGFVFVSNLLRDWWKARFGWQYLPARERGVAS